MCTPAAAIPLAFTVGSQVAGFIGSEQAASDANSYEQNLQSQIAKNANSNYLFQLQALGLRSEQEHAAVVDEGIERARSLVQERSGFATALGESGVGGNTMNRLLGEFDRQALATNDNLSTNYNWKQQQSAQEAKSYQSDAINRVISAQPRKHVGGDIFGTLANLGTAAFGAYDASQRHTRTGPYDPNKVSNDWLYQPIGSPAK